MGLTLGRTVIKRLTRSQNIFTRLTYGEAHEHTRVMRHTPLSFPGGLSGRREVKDREGRANDTLVLGQPLAKVHVAFGSCWRMTEVNVVMGASVNDSQWHISQAQSVRGSEATRIALE